LIKISYATIVESQFVQVFNFLIKTGILPWFFFILINVIRKQLWSLLK